MAMSKVRTAAVMSACLAAVVASGPASAVKINLIDIGGVTGSRAEQGFAIAARYWESVFTNDATLNVEVGYKSLGAGILGSTGSSLATYVPISAYANALAATGTSRLDAQASASLLREFGGSSTGSVDAIVPGYINRTRHTGINLDKRRDTPDGEAISNTMALTTANLKAIVGDLGTDDPDATITFSSDFKFDFNPTNGVARNAYDFIGVAVHEIGHALGFISGADDFDYSAGYTGPVDDAWWGYSLDMFRYAQVGAATQLDWSPGDKAYFSIDGGQTVFADGYFSTGEDFGYGYQASHWLPPVNAAGNLVCGGVRGIMNPYSCNGTVDYVTALDLAAFDAIGWNVNLDVLSETGYKFSSADMYRDFAASVPEPTSWAMMIGGFGFIGGAMRRRKNRVVTRVAFG